MVKFYAHWNKNPMFTSCQKHICTLFQKYRPTIEKKMSTEKSNGFPVKPMSPMDLIG
mgnify:FL=1